MSDTIKEILLCNKVVKWAGTNTPNYVSNYNLDNIDELNREIEAFNRMNEADPNAVNKLVFKY